MMQSQRIKKLMERGQYPIGVLDKENSISTQEII